jgi:phosphate transport system permease protein
MLYPYLLPAILLLTAGVYYLGRRRAERIAVDAGGLRQLHSLPSHYGVFAGLCCLFPGLVVLGLWMSLEEQIITSMVASALPEAMRNMQANELSLVINEIKNVAFGGFTASGDNAAVESAAAQYLDHLYGTRNLVVLVALVACVLPGWWALRRIHKDLRARNLVEKATSVLFLCCAVIAILTTVGIVLSVVFEAILFFRAIPVFDFLFGLQWSPQIAMRADQVGSSGAFGAVPVFVGTFLIALSP